MSPTITTASISFGTFLVGFFIGYLTSRRGRRLFIDWHLRIKTEEGTPAEEKEAIDGNKSDNEGG